MSRKMQANEKMQADEVIEAYVVDVMRRLPGSLSRRRNGQRRFSRPGSSGPRPPSASSSRCHGRRGRDL